MTALEIFLLIIGIVLIFGSFFLTDKKSNDTVQQQTGEVNVEITQAQKHKIELQVENIIDETLKKSVDKTEAEFDKISNKKMTELSDYSENIINDINKNHNEVMFLYDMLGEKEKELKSMLTEIDGTKKRVAELKEQSYAEVSKKAEDTSQFFNTKIMELKSEMENVVNAIEKAATEATETIEEVKRTRDELLNANIADNEQKDSTDNKADVIVSEDDNVVSSLSEDESDILNDAVQEDIKTEDSIIISQDDNAVSDSDNAGKENAHVNNDADSSDSDYTKSDIEKDNTVREKEYKKSKNQVSRSSSRSNGRGAQKNQKGRKNSKDHRASRYGKYDNAISSEYAKKAENTTIEFDAGANNNKQILELHSQGKTNIEIAKELGLGMGEVKLVIDLFRGGKR